MSAVALQRPAVGLLVATVGTALLVALLVPLRDEIGLINVGFAFLLLTLLVASVWGREVGLYAALISNVACNFFFFEPYHTFTVHGPENVGALVTFLVVSIVGGTLLATARKAASEARLRQAETEALLHVSRAMSATAEPRQALQALCDEVVAAFGAPGAAVLTNVEREWLVVSYAGDDSAGRQPDAEERAAATRAAAGGSMQGLGTLGVFAPRRRIVIPRGRNSVYARARPVAMVPLQLGGHAVGILRLDGPVRSPSFLRDPERLLQSFAAEAAIALHRAELAAAAAHAEALREADEMKNALLASISHDLKTPLAGIKAAITSLLDGSVPWSNDDIRAFYRAIDSQTDRLDRVINDILDLNRLEAGSLVPEKEPVSVRLLLEDACDATRFETQGRQITVDVPADFAVIADAALIRQALVNLIENAVKYSIPGGALYLGASLKNGEGAIIVEDSGPGIAPADLPFIFNRFYRAEESSRRVKGSGLGLTIVKGFVELSGGRVQVTSSANGTRFTILLPAVVPVASEV